MTREFINYPGFRDLLVKRQVELDDQSDLTVRLFFLIYFSGK